MSLAKSPLKQNCLQTVAGRGLESSIRPFSISWCSDGRRAFRWDYGPSGLLEDCDCEEGGVAYRVLSESAAWLSLAGSPSGAPRWCRDGWGRFMGHFKVCIPVTQCSGGCGSFWALGIWGWWQNTAKWGCSRVLRVWSWDHSGQVSHLHANLTSQNGSFWSLTALRFHNLLIPKAAKQVLLFMGVCHIIVVQRGIWTSDILFGHLTDFTLFYLHFIVCISDSEFDKNQHSHLLSGRSIPDVW